MGFDVGESTFEVGEASLGQALGAGVTVESEMAESDGDGNGEGEGGGDGGDMVAFVGRPRDVLRGEGSIGGRFNGGDCRG